MKPCWQLLLQWLQHYWRFLPPMMQLTIAAAAFGHHRVAKPYASLDLQHLDVMTG